MPGQDKPMKLNKFVLANSSDILRDALLKNAVCAWLRVEDANARPVKASWVAQSADGATEGAAAKNVLELCSGQKVSVDAHTAAATLAIMNAVELRDTQATKQLVEWMKKQGTLDVGMGARMVRECSMFEDFYNKSAVEGMAVVLAKNVLTRIGLNHWSTTVEDELMELPRVFVLAADFSSPHDKFTVVRRYIKYNKDKLSAEEKRELLLQCELSELDGKDAEQLYRLDVLDTKELNDVLRVVLGRMQSKLEQQAKELRANKHERSEQAKDQQTSEERRTEQSKTLVTEKQLKQQEKKQVEQQIALTMLAKQLEQQAKDVPLEVLCGALKSQIPIKKLYVAGEPFNTMNGPRLLKSTE